MANKKLLDVATIILAKNKQGFLIGSLALQL